jgi:uncharacterized membrane protein YccC
MTEIQREIQRLEAEADRLMHACQRAENTGSPNWEWLRRKWEVIEWELQELLNRQDQDIPSPSVATVLAMSDGRK